MSRERDRERDEEAFTLTSCDEGRSLRLPNLQVTITLPDRRTLTAPLGLAPLVLGQSTECSLVLDDPKVSRMHCELRLTEQGLLIQDLDSTNGTFIQGVRVIEAFLPPLVPVTLGDSSFVVQPSGGSAILPLSTRDSFGSVRGESLVMRALFAKLERLAPTDETILLLGESGTGKEVLARAIHEKSQRNQGPFVVVDCSSIPQGMIEGELFGIVPDAGVGRVNRAGLFEAAHGGTIFLDEIGEMPLEAQQRFLRVIEARTVRRLGTTHELDIDIRILAATHRNLKAMVEEGKFRQDLYFRLSVFEILVPPLRERKDDIPSLIEGFLSKRTQPVQLSDLPPETIPMLMGYDWPGNVRELRTVVSRLVLFPELLHEIVGPAAGQGAETSTRASTDESASTAPEETRLGPLFELGLAEAREALLSEFESKYIREKLRKYEGNITRTAEAMGTSRQNLYRLITRHNISAK